ncbi:LAFE_0F03620g1_1 [Lachancea fermentati]|uniref:LAFE_0F03620g1_1 n=1 Tax=Lachancea fermentati TaxID=4955 RepID=A0A1G4MEV2_LACFM|nr:LAFE_0F03620g1_1 [Lachancea fermentati]
MPASIGVLAGMGPRSTAPFVDMLIQACQDLYDARNDMDFPKMHIISLPTPFYPGIPVIDRDMANALKRGIAELVKVGVDLIVVPCNLAHVYFTAMIEASKDIPLLHIADCALRRLPAQITHVAIIGAAPTLESGIYQHRIRAKGKVVVNTIRLQELATELISLVKERGFIDKQVENTWRKVLSEAKQGNADAILVACTDISPLITEDQSLVIIDAAVSLAEAAVHASYSSHCQILTLTGSVT